MPMIRRLLAAVVAAGVTMLAAAAAEASPKAAIFPFELIDVSLEGEYIGPDSHEAERLRLITEELRKLAAREGAYDVLDLGSIAPEIAKAAPILKCSGCDVDLARRVGADVAITGFVRKVSNLVLEMHLIETDVATGKVTKTHRVEMRGNTDETWLRGVHRLLANHLG
jgi:uncharacterized protein DUF2380